MIQAIKKNETTTKTNKKKTQSRLPSVSEFLKNKTKQQQQQQQTNIWPGDVLVSVKGF